MSIRMKKIVNKHLGEILVDWGLINTQQLEEALELQKKKGDLLGEILVQLNFVKEEDIVQALTAQYGFPYLPLNNYEIDPDVLQIIPARLVRQHLLVPVDKIGKNLTIAMSNPLNTQVIEDIELLSGCSVQTFVSTASDIKATIEKYYKNTKE